MTFQPFLSYWQHLLKVEAVELQRDDLHYNCITINYAQRKEQPRFQ